MVEYKHTQNKKKKGNKFRLIVPFFFFVTETAPVFWIKVYLFIFLRGESKPASCELFELEFSKSENLTKQSVKVNLTERIFWFVPLNPRNFLKNFFFLFPPVFSNYDDRKHL